MDLKKKKHVNDPGDVYSRYVFVGKKIHLSVLRIIILIIIN